MRARIGILNTVDIHLRIETIDQWRLREILVKAGLLPDIDADEDEPGESDGQPGDGDDRIDLVLQQATERDFEVADQHTMWLR